MAKIREGHQSVLLIVDVQVEVVRTSWERDRIIRNIGLALAKARQKGMPVIWVQHSDEELIFESPEWQIVPELTPAAGENKIYKNFNSAFENTKLEEVLSGLGATHIVLAGAATNWCIRATAYAALERGYDLTLVSDGHTTGSIELDDGSKVEAKEIITDLNVTMSWLAYPGRVNAARTAEEIEF